MSCYC
ncbi:flp pilus assembly protein CpaB, partial [Vibrio harveyi]